jgi:hypothetical protein
MRRPVDDEVWELVEPLKPLAGFHRTVLMRISENPLRAKFAELPFYARG